MSLSSLLLGFRSAVFAPLDEGSGGLLLLPSAEAVVNTTTANDQTTPAVVVLANGGHVVLWQSNGQDSSGWGVYGRLTMPDGTVGPEFRVNTYTASDQGIVQVAALADGGFVATWQSSLQDGSGRGVFGQRYDAAGVAVGAEFQVNTTGYGHQQNSRVVGLADGGFVVTWQGTNDPNGNDSIYQRRYDREGRAVGVEVQVSPNGPVTTIPSLAALADGGWVIGWQRADGTGQGVFQQRYDAAGKAVGTMTQANSASVGYQTYPAMVGLADGGWVVAWTGADGSSAGVFGQRFDSAGQVVGARFRLNTYTIGDQSGVKLAATADGGFVATWHSAGQDGSGWGVYGQRFDANGVARDGEFRINDTTAGDQILAAVAAGADGGFVVAWQATGQDGAGWGVVEKSYQYNKAPVASDVAVNVLERDPGTVFAFQATDADARQPLQISVLDRPVRGSVVNNGDGTFTFVAGSDFNHLKRGEVEVVSFHYRATDEFGAASDAEVRVSVLGANGAPVLGADAFDGVENVALTLQASALLANDSDEDGDVLSIVGVGNAVGGSVAFDRDSGRIVFTPTANTTGPVSFQYTVDDGYGGVATQTVTITLAPDDTPVGGGSSESLAQSAETVANTYKTGDQTAPALAMLANGGHVTLWQSNGQDGSGWGVYGQLTALDGSRGPEFRVNTYTTSDQSNVQVAALAGGGFMVTWQSNGQDGAGWGVYGQRFDAAGVAIGSEIRLNASTVGNQQNCRVVGLADGGFVVTWQGSGSSSTYEIWARRYDRDGRAVDNKDVRVNSLGTVVSQYAPSVAALAGGGWVVSWESTDASGRGISQRRYDAVGNAGSITQVNTLTTGDQTNPMVVGLIGGGWVVAWTELDATSTSSLGLGVYGQRYDAAGAKVGSRFRLNTYTVADQSAVKLAATANGGFVATWQSVGQDGSGAGLYGQRFDATGVMRGGEFRINDTIIGDQSGLAVVADPNGGFITAWQSAGQDGSGWGVIEKTYAPSGVAPVIKATGAMLAQGSSILASALLAEAHVQGDAVTPWGLQTYTRYAFEDVTVGGGHFEVKGVVQTGPFEVAAADLATVRWVAGSMPGSDTYRVRASDGLRWSAWMEADVKTEEVGRSLAPSNETVVNTTTIGDQTAPALAVLANGGRVVLWQSGDGSGLGVYGRVTAPDGGVGPEFRVNTYTVSDQSNVQVAGLAGGGFVATWQSNGQDGSGWGIYGQRFDSTGVPVGSEFKLNEVTNNQQQDSRVVGLPDGGFLTMWKEGSSEYTGRIRRYDCDGHAVDDTEIELITYNRYYPSIALLKDGGWVISWYDPKTSSGNHITQCRFSAAGKAGSITDVYGTSETLTTDTAVVGLADGGWVVAWVMSIRGNTTLGMDLYGQRYDAAGNKVGSSFLFNTTMNGDQSAVKLAATADGGFVATWQSADGSGAGLYGQRFDAQGVMRGGEFRINDTIAGDQSGLAVVADPNGGFITAWQSAGQDGSGYAIIEKTYAPSDEAPVIKATGALVAQGASILASALLAEAHVQGDAVTPWGLQVYTRYAFEDVTMGGGHFEVKGVVQTGPFEVTAADLATVRWVAGAMPGSDTYRVRAFDGLRWSAWMEADAKTVMANGSLAPSGEMVVNTTTVGDQTAPALAVLANGGRVVLWQSGDSSGLGVYGRVTAPDGGVGPEFRVNTYTASDQSNVQVAALTGGGFVVTWQSNGQDNAYWGIYGQRFDSTGVPIGGEFKLNETTNGRQQNSRVVGLVDSGFVITWQDETSAIWMRCYDRDGHAVGSKEVQVSRNSAASQIAPSVAALTGGGWVVSWENSDATGRGISQCRYDAAGNAGSITQVNTLTAGDQKNPIVVGLAGGGWVVTWSEPDGTSASGLGLGVYGQRFDTAGAKVGSRFRLNTYTVADQSAVKLAATSDGGFIATWQSNGQDGSSWGVYGQRFDANGMMRDGEFRINDTLVGDQSNPAVAVGPDGSFVFAWQSSGQDGSGYAVVEKTYAPAGSSSRMLFNPPGADTLTGGNGADTFAINRGAGADVIDNRGHGDDGDTILFGAGIAADQLWFQRQGDDLKLSIIGTTDSVTISAWYADPANRVSALATDDGSHILAGQVDNLVSAMAAFNPPAAGQTQLTTQQHQALDPVIAAHWQSH